MTKQELVAWVHDKAAMNNSMGTAEEIVETVLTEIVGVMNSSSANWFNS